MTWVALMQREFKEHVRPATKWSGTLIAALLLTVILSVGATVGAGFAAAAAQKATGGELPLHITILITMAAGIAVGQLTASMVPMNLGIDTAAGERERHTLGTLLATPLSDAAILWAKTVAILGVTGIVAAAGGVAIWITTSILFGGYGILWGILAVPGMIVVSLITGFFTVCFAAIFSARAKTVRDAGQRLSFIVLPTMIPIFLLGPLLEADSMVPLYVVLGIYGAASSVGIVLVPLLAFTRFRRERLLTV